MPPRIVRYPPIQCNTRERQAQSKIPIAPPAWRIPEGPESLAAVPVGGGGAWPGNKPTRRGANQRPGHTGVEGAGGSGGHGRASRSTTPSEARVWRSRGRPGPTAPGTPAAQQATPEIWRDHSHNRQRPGRLLHNSPHGSSPRRPRHISYDV